jgi:hypothetical protein
MNRFFTLLVALLALSVVFAAPASAGPEDNEISQFGYSLDFGPQDIMCEGTNRVQLLYGYTGDTPNRYGQSHVMAEIRDAAYDASGIMNSEAEIHSNERSGSRVRYACTSGAPSILNAGQFPADGGYPDTTSFRARLCNLGYTRSDRVYLVLLDGYKKTNYASSTCTGGRYAVISVSGYSASLISGLLSDPNRAVVNRNTFLHEMLHTFGAVPRTAPNSYINNGGHCDEGRDVMCYGPENDTSFCPERTWVDCNGQDYFNPTPAPGSWLYNNPALNIGHCTEPFTNCAYTGRGKEPTENQESVPPFESVFDVAFDNFPTEQWNEVWDTAYWETVYPVISGLGS